MLCLAPAAHAASSVVVRGAGFGHGIGMSQYGAYGFAQNGFSYQRILSHYYSGTRHGHRRQQAGAGAAAGQRPVRARSRRHARARRRGR